MNHLDGVQAVAYARLRLMDTDFNRTERQRKVLGLAMEKAKNADFNTLRVLIGTVFPQISTSIGVDDLMVMAKDVKKYYIGQTTGFPFSHTEMIIEKRDCVVPTTLESNVIQLHEFLYDDTHFLPSGVVKNISAHIAKVSGIDTPGKDIESGRNAGTEGNTGNQQNSQAEPSSEPVPANTDATSAETPASSEEGSASDTTEADSEAADISTTEESSETAAGPMETDETKTPAETTAAPSPKPSQGPVSAPGDSPEASDTNGPGNGPGVSDNQPNGALEAPGQGNGPVSGPGA